MFVTFRYHPSQPRILAARLPEKPIPRALLRNHISRWLVQFPLVLDLIEPGSIQQWSRVQDCSGPARDPILYLLAQEVRRSARHFETRYLRKATPVGRPAKFVPARRS